MQGQQRRGNPGPRAAAEPKAPAGRRDLDINRERLIYCLTSLVGHRATAKCRNNVVYEGIFHSCALENDYSITLKSAKLVPTKGDKNGEVIGTLVIPGKDFLQVSVMDVPQPTCQAKDRGSRRFAIDSEIGQTRSRGVVERELVPWQPSEGDWDDRCGGDHLNGLDALVKEGSWDQFSVNERLYGLSSTFNEELYTTKLDPNTIPKEKREEAERIAAEIERERSHAEAEEVLNGDYADDEEWRFSAVGGSGAYRRKEPLVGSGPSASSAKGRGRPGRSNEAPPLQQSLAHSLGLTMPLTKEHLNQHEALSGGADDSYAREHRAKRGMITDHRHVAHSPMRSPMITEMKRINALNLEPALPKLDDKTRNDWINFKQSQTRPSAKSAQGHALKTSLQQSLELIRTREATKAAVKASHMSSTVSAEGDFASGHIARGSADVVGDGPLLPASKSPSSGDKTRSFTFNPGAKEFSFNPAVVPFSPEPGQSGSARGSSKPSHDQTPQQQQHGKAHDIGPQFAPRNPHPDMLKIGLVNFLDGFLERVAVQRSEASSPSWPSAVGARFREVLGQPSMQPSLMPMPMMPSGCQGAPAQGSWQMQQKLSGASCQNQHSSKSGGVLPQCTGPSTMTGGFVVGGGNSGGQQGTAGFPQMYQGSRQMQPGQGSGMQQQQQQQPQSGQHLVFPQAVPTQGMMVPGTMQGGTAIAGMPKFGAQMVPVMMPAGQFGPPQGFMQGQGQMMPPQGQMMPQGQIMQPQVGFSSG